VVRSAHRERKYARFKQILDKSTEDERSEALARSVGGCLRNLRERASNAQQRSCRRRWYTAPGRKVILLRI
jgi:hypothetical protein